MKRFVPVIGLALLLASCSSSTPPTTAATTAPSSVQAPAAADTVSTAALPLDPGMKTDTAASAQATEPYNITLKFAAGSSQSVIDAMSAAARRWESAVTQGLPSVTGSIAANSCGSNAAFSGTIDDILIFTGNKTIDGPGGILAQSGPCSIRSASGLTTYSTLVFDTADLSQFASQLADIAVHEMGHSLGIGTLWQNFGLVSGIGTTNPTYKGGNGLREWRALSGSTAAVPVENTGGSGTAGGHWRETTFKNELMTGYLNSGYNPLSRLSIGSLQDMGYSVNYAAAQSYTYSAAALKTQGLDGLELNEQLITPTYRVE
jgi:Leishmanolysin